MSRWHPHYYAQDWYAQLLGKEEVIGLRVQLCMWTKENGSNQAIQEGKGAQCRECTQSIDDIAQSLLQALIQRESMPVQGELQMNSEPLH